METELHSANFARLFEAQAARTPGAIAVVFGDVTMSYGELNGRANQLARYLREACYEQSEIGIKPLPACGEGLEVGLPHAQSSPRTPFRKRRGELIIGICFDRTPEMVVAILATLKAGGAYLPLDPSYPTDRLAFMLQDAGATVLLTSSAHASGVLNMPEPCGPAICCLDSEWPSIERNASTNLDIEIARDSLAYVIYTSGSTGSPKGAMITHRGLANYLSWAAENYDVASGCGAPVHSSISFDLTVTSLFTPLMVGRSVFLVPDGIESLAGALLERSNFSLVKITPAHLRALAELLPAEQLAGRVRALVIGGEALHYQSLAFWRRHAPATRIINEYGPTETVVGCCVYEVTAADENDGPVPIGRPIANTELHVFDENLTPVSAGETGELFIGGEGVARGYLNREELTRERFVANPLAEDQLLYRSGDLVRQLADGNLEYLGRVDHQVKIRGYRIELGEIETALKEHPAVSDCAVIVSETNGDEKRLVAFVQNEAGATFDEEALRYSLQRTLPDYMVPTGWVCVPALPLTINGKVDRQALAAQAPAPTSNGNHVEPRNPAEQTLAGIWAEVLKVDRVSVNDNFFDLGGDSILGTLILARAARAGLKLSPSQLFEYQTIAELAAVAGITDLRV